ncbi:hypothetical protein M441DRAFT_40049 [Trichoderma asperellum CBS 433.97]|uniref:Aminotransferase class V domain-containing protein n=1 Tax=Trichoderma asperellum (strain ATCC 204424 / CBS 433.97 / NBRC 101777) TaxID=1042311 RepID=A0A2T3YXJ8_TRIA4|nr:hypothetical protein M441DRAFT_40049 [Trichoderma asperellum CBS 433.97]PTB37272.1 hypothetical protein M441DRAFT_40049 [Trichoderma asperellum CBS 433.97]
MSPSITTENGECASHHLNGKTATEATKYSNGAANPSETIRDAIDTEQVRSHFPILSSGETVLFNNASGTVILRDAVTAASDRMNAMPLDRGDGDPRSDAAQAEYAKNWNECAAFINAEPSEIAFGPSTTALMRLLSQSIQPYLNTDAEMVCSTLCHEAAAASWVLLARNLGITIKWWTPSQDETDSPCLTVESLKPLLTPKTRLVTCNHVSNVVGTIHPIRELADLVHTIPGCMIAVDGVAWAPHRPVDVKALDVDFYCFSWYKVFGPHLAQLYAHRRAQDRYMSSINHYFLDHSSLDGKLHLGNVCYELEAMCGPISKYLGNLGWDAIIQQETVLTKVFLDYLLSRPTVYRVFGKRTADPSQRVSIVIFEVLGRKSSDVVMQIHVRDKFRLLWGDGWAPRATFDVLRPHSDGIIRASFVHYNTVSEVLALCNELEEVISTCN